MYFAFKSCRIYHIYELIAHEHHHNVVIMSGKLFKWSFFFKPRGSELGACQWENMLDAMVADMQICSVCIDGKFAEIKEVIIFVI